MTPTPTVTLADAIAAVEQTEATRAAVAARRQSDQDAAEAAQKKADAAKSVVTGDLSDEQTATTAEVSALNDLKGAIDARIAELNPPAAA